MKPMCLVNLVGLSVLLAASGVVPAGEAPTLEERLWPIARRGQDLPPGEQCRLLEKFCLLAVAPGIGQDATVLTAVIDFQFPGDTLFRLVRLQSLMPMVEQAKKEGYLKSEEERKLFDEFYKRKFMALEVRMLEASAEASKRPVEWHTLGLHNATLVESYFRNDPRKSLEEVVRQFASDNLLSVGFKKEERPGWDALVKAIDGKIPVILQDKKGILVALGYYRSDKEEVLFLYDPVKARCRVRTGDDWDKTDPRTVADPKRRAIIQADREKKHIVDFLLDPAGDLPPGLVAKPWAEVQDSTATYISNWSPDIEATYKELKAYLDARNPKENQK